MRKWMFGIWMVYSLFGCTVGTDYQKTDVFSDLKIAQNLHLTGENHQVLRDWYKSFDDNRLNTLVTQALNQNADILSALEKLRQARTISKISKVQYLPTFDVKGGYDYMKASKNIISADTDNFLIGFDADWEIDIWGKGRRTNEQKRAEFQSARYSLQNIKNAITSEVASTYFILKTLEEQKRIAQKNLTLQGDILETIRQKYQSGLLAESSYHQASYLYEKTKALIPSFDEQIAIQKNALAVLIGDLPNIDENEFSGKTNPISKAYHYDTTKLFSLPINIIRLRPDVRAAEESLKAQNAAVGAAVADLYPNVSLSALFGFESKNASDLFVKASQTYAYQPSVLAPIFHWGQLQNAVELAREKKAEVYQNYRKTILESTAELANAIVAVQKEYKANRSKRNALSHARQAFDAMRRKYLSGLIEYSTLLESEQDLLTAELDLAVSNGTIYQNLIAFYKATGGGYNSAD